MSKEVFEYDGLVIGDAVSIPVILEAGQSIKRGDLLVAVATEGVPSDVFVKDTDGAKMGNVYAIAADDVATEEEQLETAAYIAGKFSREKVTEQTSEGNYLALSANGIHILKVRG